MTITFQVSCPDCGKMHDVRLDDCPFCGYHWHGIECQCDECTAELRRFEAEMDRIRLPEPGCVNPSKEAP